MSARRVGGAAERVVSNSPPPVIDRVTVTLIPKAAEDLQRLQESTGLSKTDIVNRAIRLYEFIEEQLRLGRDVLTRDQVTGQVEKIQIF